MNIVLPEMDIYSVYVRECTILEQNINKSIKLVFSFPFICYL